MKDLKDLERQFSYLSEIQDFQEIRSRARSNIRELEFVIKEYNDSIERISRTLNEESIDVTRDDYLEVVEEYTNNLPKNARLYHLLNSGFMKGTNANRQVKVIDGEKFDIKEEQGKCLLVEYNDSGIDYMRFDSNIQKIHDKFPEFTTDELFYGTRYFIYHPRITYLKLEKMKETHDSYVDLKGKSLKDIEAIRELRKKYTRGDT